VPGALKNALDVASRPYGQSAWNGKPGAVISASPGAIGGFVQRDNQDENLASIRMRKGRRWREEGRAQPDLSYASGGGVRPKGGVWR